MMPTFPGRPQTLIWAAAVWAATAVGAGAQAPAGTATAPADVPPIPSSPPPGGVIRAALMELYTRPRARPAPRPAAGNREIPVNSNNHLGTRPAGPDTSAPPASPTPSPSPGESGSSAAPAAGAVFEPWGGWRTPARLPAHRREWTEYRYFDGNPSRYGYGRYRGDLPAGGSGVEGEYFRFGFLEGYDAGQFDRTTHERVQAVLRVAQTHLDRGLQWFHEGQYAEAADAFRLAADKDQGDAVSRLYAAHALFALGRYREAAPFLRRAFELQPHIVFLNYDIRGDYGNPADFDAQYAQLLKALELNPNDPDRLLLQGYILYYTRRRTEAFGVLDRLCTLVRSDALATRLRDNARPSDIELDARRPGRAK